MAANKIKPAFPGRASAMGYEPGLTKLEWVATILCASPDYDSPAEALEAAKQLIELCAKAEES